MKYMSKSERITALPVKPVIIPRDKHNLSRSSISDNALKVLYRLKNAGYKAYLVGGSVRDLLLGREPKDFDIATDADLPAKRFPMKQHRRLLRGALPCP